MRIKLYADIGIDTKKEDIWFAQTPNGYKMPGHKRYEVIVNIPDPDDLVDYTINAHSVEEVTEDDK